MKRKIPFVIFVISLISATVLALNNTEQFQSQVLDINHIAEVQPFGTLKQVDLNKLEYKEGRTAYDDTKYHYLVNSDGSLNVMFLIDNTLESDKKIKLDKDSSLRVSENFIKGLMPKFDANQYQIQFNENEGYISSIYYYLVDKNSTQHGAIVVSFNEYGEVSSVYSDLMPNILDSTKNDINTLSEDKAIELAYNAVDNWIKNQKQSKQNTIINPKDDPKALDSQIITNDLGEQITNETEFVENIEYDISNKPSHSINATSYFNKDKNKLCWMIEIEGIKRTINKWESNCSFLINMDAETGEIYNIDYTR